MNPKSYRYHYANCREGGFEEIRLWTSFANSEHQKAFLAIVYIFYDSTFHKNHDLVVAP